MVLTHLGVAKNDYDVPLTSRQNVGQVPINHFSPGLHLEVVGGLHTPVTLRAVLEGTEFLEGPSKSDRSKSRSQIKGSPPVLVGGCE